MLLGENLVSDITGCNNRVLENTIYLNEIFLAQETKTVPLRHTLERLIIKPLCYSNISDECIGISRLLHSEYETILKWEYNVWH